MTFLEYIETIKVEGETVITMGNFDGIHLGHMELVNKAVELGNAEKLESIAFTYDIHPLSFLYAKAIHLIMSNQDKEKILLSKGIDKVLHVPFDDELRSMTSKEFCDKILIGKLNAKHLVMGADAKFGSEMKTINEIKEYCEKQGLQVHIIPLLIVDGMRISSSYIRMLIEHGEIEKANKFLGRAFSLESQVVHGKKLGRQIGFPTANLNIGGAKAIPAKGVYKTIVEIEGKKYTGATNVGTNPTVGDKNLTVETYILGFDGDLYGKTIKVEFIRRLRAEIKFDKIQQLIDQMNDDIKNIIENK